jgi:ATP-dependent RNA helicase DeaD
VLRRLRSKRLDLLIATDVASRGIDVQHVTHVINLELPRDREGYVHRIGRTGRAGRHGVAITFVTPKHKHRMRSLARSLGVDIKEMEVPSDAAIAGRRRERLQAALAEAVEGEMDPARAWLKQVQEKSGLSLEDLAASAVSLLAGDRDVALADPEGSDEGWIRPPSQHDHVVRDPVRSNEVELFFPIGRFRHVRPGDLVGAIANEAGVPGHEIGRITIVDRKSFVGMPREVANAILERHPSLTVRGIEVPVVLAHPRQSHPDGPPRRGFRKEGGGRPRFGGGRSGPPRGPKRGDKRYSK